MYLRSLCSGQCVTCTQDAGPQGKRMRLRAGRAVVCHGQDDRSRLGLACLHRCFFVLPLDFLDKLCRFSGGV